MNKNKLILIITILIVLVGAIFWFIYALNSAKKDNAPLNYKYFVPFRRNAPTPVEQKPTEEKPPVVEENQEESTKRLVKVSSFPISGFYLDDREVLIPEEPIIPEISIDTLKTKTTVIKKTAQKTESKTFARYNQRSTGNIYETPSDPKEERRVTNTTIPKIREAFFGQGGNYVLLRMIKSDYRTIGTFLGIIPKEVPGGDSLGEVKGDFLPDDILDVSVSPDYSQYFYILKVGDGVSGIVTSFKDGKRTEVFKSPFTEWLTLWPNSREITLTTKPSSSVPGFAYSIDPKTKSFSKILGGINGLTTLTSPSGKITLYSKSADGSFYLSIFDNQTKNSSDISLRTLPEKCAWSAGSENIFCSVPKAPDRGEYPDIWYQGIASFSDNIWRVDTKTRTTTLLINPLEEGVEEIDGTKLHLNKKETKLYFVNKKDSFLWSLDLTK